VGGRDFVLRVRGASSSRLFRFAGAEATDLHRLREAGAFERPGGTGRLNELIRQRGADDDEPSVESVEPDFDMVADDELRGYLSRRLLERRGGRE
jgi:hypothetical protein